MNRKTIYIVLFVISVLGLFVIQYQYLRISLNLAKVQFDRKIAEAGAAMQEDLQTQNQLTFLLAQGLTNNTQYFKLSSDSLADASRHFLDDFVTQRLNEKGVEATHSYRLFTRDSTYYLKAPREIDLAEGVNAYTFELSGYLPERLGQKVYLELQFVALNRYFLFQLNGLIIPGLLFSLIIILVVIWVLRSFYWQRKIITTTNEFINNLTHELKTPVFAIGIATKLLQKDASEAQEPVIQSIRQQTERLKLHIEKVLDLARIESRKRYFNLIVVDFKPNIEAVCTTFKAMAALENIPFHYSLSKEAFPIKAEPVHLENALQNLLDNAKKYGQESAISLAANIIGNHLTIAITDEGPGISVSEQKKVFQKYYRGSQESQNRVSGYGLGLSYVKEVIKKHNGTLKLQSELQRGTTVIIRIPIHE
ncbi:sensor histidine kinase [Altibacter sp. HG106]|uniref:sensor histidine kinase n=1 Tax=Altibacter sp. HG106 TaxID=3023937 RepID=UPI002350A028|nr:HAMP domain-containing sensor histidine kinase [Altibacter sp. HG106]MDC7995346.1 HAMP domain-containing sensor histidine kinase [Altibacter sp. HG106]